MFFEIFVNCRLDFSPVCRAHTEYLGLGHYHQHKLLLLFGCNMFSILMKILAAVFYSKKK